MTTPDRLVSPHSQNDSEQTVRPLCLSDFVGQEALRQNLSVFIGAARQRGEAMDHVLFFGPPGLGKTLWRRLWRRNWGWVSAPRPAR